jgi:hypothetical protein
MMTVWSKTFWLRMPVVRTNIFRISIVIIKAVRTKITRINVVRTLVGLTSIVITKVVRSNFVRLNVVRKKWLEQTLLE